MEAGDAVKFLPPTRFRPGAAADVLAACPRKSCCDLYELMSASRKWETAMKDLFLGGKDGLYGAFHTYVGEEAIAVGVIGALNDDDYIASTHRGHGHLIAKGGDLNKMSAEIFFKETGYNKGYGGSMHITDMSKGIMGMNGIVGASYYMAAGAALHGMVRGTKQVAVAFFGDGARRRRTTSARVRSCANLKMPVIFVTENNFQYMGVPMAITVPPSTSRNTPRASTSRIILVDGNDVTAVYAATQRGGRVGARRQGPEHDRGDDLSLVRPRRVRRRPRRSGRARWGCRTAPTKKSDSGCRAIRSCASRTGCWRRGWPSKAELAGLEQKAQAAVEASVEFARKSADPTPEAGVLNTYAKGAAEATQFFNRKGLASQPRLT